MLALGILLIVLGIGLIIGEFFTGSHLLLALGAIFAVAGLVIAALSGTGLFQVNWWLVSILIVVVLGALAGAVIRIRATYRRQVATGKEDLKGKTALVKETLNPEGIVLCEGELWQAVSNSGLIKVGEEVIVTKVTGLKLSVVKKEPQ